MMDSKEILTRNACSHLYDELLKKGRVNSDQIKAIESVLPVVISNYNKHYDKLNNCESSMNNSNQFVDIKISVGEDKANKHPHHDLIIEWLMDTSTRFQSSIGNGIYWSGCSIASLVSDVEGEIMFRIKPRKFVKGHWYPCIALDGSENVMIFHNQLFSPAGAITESLPEYKESELKWIGESLGEIKFGE